MFCFKKLTAFGYADITLTLDNSILSDDRSILRLSFARFTRRYWEHHSYFLVLPLVICLNSGGSLASREIICVYHGMIIHLITSKSEEIGRFIRINRWSILTNHRKLFNPHTWITFTVNITTNCFVANQINNTHMQELTVLNNIVLQKV
jgi:hypothetical protein